MKHDDSVVLACYCVFMLMTKGKLMMIVGVLLEDYLLQIYENDPNFEIMAW